MTDTLFAKIIRKELPATIVYEDEDSLAFKDIHPAAPVHILVVPKTPLDRLSSATDDQERLLGHLLVVANQVAKAANLTDYRIVVNNGAEAGQTVFHLHVHVLGGRTFSWPPG